MNINWLIDVSNNSMMPEHPIVLVLYLMYLLCNVCITQGKQQGEIQTATAALGYIASLFENVRVVIAGKLASRLLL